MSKETSVALIRPQVVRKKPNSLVEKGGGKPHFEDKPDGVRQYFIEIGRVELLTRPQERTLAQQIEEGHLITTLRQESGQIRQGLAAKLQGVFW